MKHISLRKGLNLPISGAARPEIDETKTITSVGIIGADYIDLKPRITVAEGDLVSVGTPLMADKTMEEAKVVSPIAGPRDWHQPRRAPETDLYHGDSR